MDDVRGHQRGDRRRVAELQRVDEVPRGAGVRERDVAAVERPVAPLVAGGASTAAPTRMPGTAARPRATARGRTSRRAGRAGRAARRSTRLSLDGRRRTGRHASATIHARDAPSTWTVLGAAADVSWTLDPGPILLVLILGGLYLPRWWRVRRDDGAAAAPVWRLLSYLVGLAAS